MLGISLLSSAQARACVINHRSRAATTTAPLQLTLVYKFENSARRFELSRFMRQRSKLKHKLLLFDFFKYILNKQCTLIVSLTLSNPLCPTDIAGFPT